MENAVQQDPSAGGERQASRWVGGAAVAAVVASACCLGPIALAGLGLSVAGFSAAFESLRPVFLVLTVALLGGAFYATYFRRPACRPREACAVDGQRTRRTRAFLWLVTLGVVLVALFPVYGGSVLRFGASSGSVSPAVGGQVVTLSVDGMTCGACAASIEKSLRALPGVVAAAVSYEDGEAVVETAADAPPTPEALLKAVKAAGYEARVQDESPNGRVP